MKIICFIIWLVDVLNISYVINGTNIKDFLDITLPLNFWFWFLFWALVPSSRIIFNKGD